MYIRINEKNPDEKSIAKVIELLRSDGVIIYPTDTVYAIGCDIFNTKAFEKLCRIKQVKPEKANFSFICCDLSHISDFTLPFETSVYKLMKRNLPGAFTFILKANNSIPKLFKNNKKTVGIRVPDNDIIRSIVKLLGNPIVTTSIQMDETADYPNDPEVIYAMYQGKIDAFIDGGFGGLEPSTIVDCSDGEINIIREGAGELT